MNAALHPRHQRVAAYAVIRRTLADGTDEILLSRVAERISAQEMWTLPGGGVEHGEDPRDAVVREVYEETSVQIRINTKFRETVRYSPLPGVSKEVVYFLTTTEQEKIRPQEGEIAEVEWVPIEEAEASLTHENDKTVFRAAMKSAALTGAKRNNAENNTLAVVLLHIGQRYGTVDFLHTPKNPLLFSVCSFSQTNMNEP